MPTEENSDTTPDLKSFGITFTESAVAANTRPLLPNGSNAVTSDEAIASALPYSSATDADGKLLPNVQVNAVFGLFSDSQIRPLGSTAAEALYQNVPAWIVTFTGDGVQVISSGPWNSPAYVKHAQSVIIDAKTGHVIESIA